MDIDAFADEFKTGRIAVSVANSDEMRAIVRLVVKEIGFFPIKSRGTDGLTEHLLNGGDTDWRTFFYRTDLNVLEYANEGYHMSERTHELISYSELGIYFPDDIQFSPSTDDQFTALLFGD